MMMIITAGPEREAPTKQKQKQKPTKQKKLNNKYESKHVTSVHGVFTL